MKTGLTLNELAAKITSNSKSKEDFIAPTQTTSLVPSDGPEKVRLSIPTDSGTQQLPMLPLAHRQIATHLKIPAQYYDRMLDTKPELLADNVNAWLHAEDTKRMVRTMHGSARAFLSDRYHRIENDSIAEAALEVLQDMRGVQIVSSEITDQRLYIHFVVPTVQGEVKVGDVVQAGGIIQNSEVGLGSASVSGLIWRLWCLNGAKTGEAYRKNHVGRKIDDNDALWADDTRRADDKTILLKVRDMVRAVVDETRFRQTLGKMQTLADGKIESRDFPKVVETLALKMGAPDSVRGGILASLVEGGDLSAWGLMNAVTHQAHKARDYDQAVEFETMGGKLIDLPKSDWKQILQAA